MKKLICITLSLALALSSSVAVVYAKNDSKGNSGNAQSSKYSDSKEKGDSKDEKVTEKSSGASTGMDALKEQLKLNHKDKEKRKALIKEIVNLKKQNKDNSISVFVEGTDVEFDVPPVIKEGRTLIPVRAVTNALGADVEWDAATKTATVSKAVYDKDNNVSKIVITLNLENNVTMVNGTVVKLEIHAQVVSNRTMVPLRFIAETFKKLVEWDKETGSVIIDDDDTATPTPVPTVTPAPSATPAPTAVPTATPAPTVEPTPTATPTPAPTAEPAPTATPAPAPTAEPAPTATPTPAPTAEPTATPTPAPTEAPAPTATPAP